MTPKTTAPRSDEDLGTHWFHADQGPPMLDASYLADAEPT